jgi:hypothetical protein
LSAGSTASRPRGVLAFLCSTKWRGIARRVGQAVAVTAAIAWMLSSEPDPVRPWLMGVAFAGFYLWDLPWELSELRAWWKDRRSQSSSRDFGPAQSITPVPLRAPFVPRRKIAERLIRSALDATDVQRKLAALATGGNGYECDGVTACVTPRLKDPRKPRATIELAYDVTRRGAGSDLAVELRWPRAFIAYMVASWMGVGIVLSSPT